MPVLYSALLTWHDEHIPVLVPSVGPVARGTVADGESRGLVANQLGGLGSEGGGGQRGAEV